MVKNTREHDGDAKCGKASEFGLSVCSKKYKVEDRELSNRVLCKLADPEGTNLGAFFLSESAGPVELQQLVNKLRNDEEKLCYAFYILDNKLMEPLGTYLQKNKVSVENVITVVCQPQAVFRICPVTYCSSTLSGHKDAVLSVFFSPDGNQLASGSGDTTVRFWDLNTQTPLFTCRGHRNCVMCVSWSPDSKYLVSGGYTGELICWDPLTGKQLGKPYLGHKDPMHDISWEPVHLAAPCHRFVSASKDGDARVWDTALRKCVICLTGHKKDVTCVKWGGDGTIYTGSRDCTIKMWNSLDWTIIGELKGHTHWVNSMALSTEYVLRTSAFDSTKKAFSSPEEMKKAALERYTKMKGKAPERLVSASDDRTMYLWQSEKRKVPLEEPMVPKKPEVRMTGHQQVVNHVHFSPDGLWIASASFDNSVKLWNGITGKFVTTFRGHVQDVYQISWSADSRLILSGSKDSTLKIWDIQTKKLKKDLPGHESVVFALDWSPNGEKAASGDMEGVLKLWL